MNKKLIIITAAAGLMSFAGSFVLAWLTKPSPPSENAEAAQQAQTGMGGVSEGIEPTQLKSETGTVGTVGAGDRKTKTFVTERMMTEKQLNELIYEVREKIREYDSKLKDLEQREQRLQLTQEMLKKDGDELNNLRVELASIVAGIKNERDQLLKSRIEIAQTEKANLVTIAAAYDKMDSASASKILTNISQMQSGKAGGSGSYDDAVKILHYMSERAKAKVLAEMVNSEPKLAAALCERLKQIVEKQ